MAKILEGQLICNPTLIFFHFSSSSFVVFASESSSDSGIVLLRITASHCANIEYVCFCVFFFLVADV